MAKAALDRTPRTVIRDEIRALDAYHVADARDMVKLDAMENPYGLPAELREQIGQLAGQASLNRYPDPGAQALKRQLRRVMEIPEQAALLLGNGSDELIQILALAVARPGAVLLSVEPSFVMFRLIAAYAGLRYVGVPLREDFSLDLPALERAIETHQPALVFLAYPNNPTGNLFDAEAMRRLIGRAPGIVVVDEAYHVFARHSFLRDLPCYPNLLVMRTLSKLGLAGLRLGFLSGGERWIGELDKLRLPYNVGVLTQQIACCVLEHPEVLETQAAAIRAERDRLFTALQVQPRVRAFPSEANFILFQIPDADAVFAELKQRAVLIKNLNGSHPRLRDCLRVTAGTPDENDQFLSALRQVVPQAA